MKIDELKTNSLWRLLTPAEQIFVETYLTNGGDTDKAVEAAFNIEDQKSARSYARKVLGRPVVTSLINVFNGEQYDPGQDELLLHLWDVVKGGKSEAARVSAANLIAEIRGWKKANKAAKQQNTDLSELLASLDKK